MFLCAQNQCYREAIESGGLTSDSWELGVAHKCLAGYFFNQNMFEAALERYSEAVSIFEWNIDNVLGGGGKQDDIIQCYAHLLDLEDDKAGPISETRAELCYKLANSYVQVNKHEGKAENSTFSLFSINQHTHGSFILNCNRCGVDV